MWPQFINSTRPSGKSLSNTIVAYLPTFRSQRNRFSSNAISGRPWPERNCAWMMPCMVAATIAAGRPWPETSAMATHTIVKDNCVKEVAADVVTWNASSLQFSEGDNWHGDGHQAAVNPGGNCEFLACTAQLVFRLGKQSVLHQGRCFRCDGSE